MAASSGMCDRPLNIPPTLLRKATYAMVRFQLVIDCADPDRMARFWKEALHYESVPAPDGFDSWDDYYRDLGLGEEDLAAGRTASRTRTATVPASGSSRCRTSSR